jgi:hypothetical protein
MMSAVSMPLTNTLPLEYAVVSYGFTNRSNADQYPISISDHAPKMSALQTEPDAPLTKLLGTKLVTANG